MTYTGNHIPLLSPKPEDINIRDIAHALSMLCRWNGQVSQFFSVAAHCIFCSYIVKPEEALRALLHDASEAYLGDVSHPLKKLLPDYKIIEAKWDSVIAEWAGIETVHSIEVKEADMISLAAEAKYLMPSGATYLDLPELSKEEMLIFGALVPCNYGELEAKYVARYVELASQ